jgi:hypothetical protein
MDNGGYSTIEAYDNNKLFPLDYECMGQPIKINRDASWQSGDSSKVIFEKLATQLSLIPGVKASQQTTVDGNSNGIKFTIDVDNVPLFTFKKPYMNDDYDVLKVMLNKDTVKVLNPLGYIHRILDKTNEPLNGTELNVILPISRFKV